MEIDRRAFIASLGGTAVVEAMSSEAKAEALEHHLSDLLDGQLARRFGSSAWSAGGWFPPGRRTRPSVRR